MSSKMTLAKTSDFYEKSFITKMMATKFYNLQSSTLYYKTQARENKIQKILNNNNKTSEGFNAFTAPQSIYYPNKTSFAFLVLQN